MKPYPFLTPGVTSHATPLLLPLIPEWDVQLFSFCLPPPLSFPTSPDNLWTSPYSHLQCPDQLPQELKTWVGELCFYIFAVFAYFAFQLLHRGAGSFRVGCCRDLSWPCWAACCRCGGFLFACLIITLKPRSVNFHRFTLNIFAAFCHTITLLTLIRQLRFQINVPALSCAVVYLLIDVTLCHQKTLLASWQWCTRVSGKGMN